MESDSCAYLADSQKLLCPGVATYTFGSKERRQIFVFVPQAVDGEQSPLSVRQLFSVRPAIIESFPDADFVPGANSYFIVHSGYEGPANNFDLGEMVGVGGVHGRNVGEVGVYCNKVGEGVFCGVIIIGSGRVELDGVGRQIGAGA